MEEKSKANTALLLTANCIPKHYPEMAMKQTIAAEIIFRLAIFIVSIGMTKRAFANIH